MIKEVEVDDKLIDQFSLHERCLQENICPKGCGPLERRSPQERICPVCGFTHWAFNERAPHTTQ